MNSQGALNYARLSFRTDRLYIIIWILGILLLTIMIPPAFNEMFTNEAERLVMAETMANPAMVAMCGPNYDPAYGNGAMMAQMMLVFTALAAGLMNLFFVSKHTRRDEEEGRAELLYSLPMSRLSGLISTILLVVLMNLALALLIGVCLAVMGIEGMDSQGSFLYGAAIGVAGLVFASIAALFAQLSQGSRGANAFSLVILGLAYLLRAVGDIGDEILSLISPLGLICRTEVYVNDYWWPILVCIGISAVLFILSVALNVRRDMDQGLLPHREGKAYSKFLSSPLALNLRLLRTQIIAWTITMLILGAAYGSIFGDIELFLASSDVIKMVFAADPNVNMEEQFVVTLMMIMSIIAVAAVLMMVLKIKSEEGNGRLDMMIAGPVSRQKYLFGIVCTALVYTVVLQLATIIGMWSAAYAVMEDPIDLAVFMQAGFVYLPSIYVFIGLSVLLIGFAPKLTNLAWLYLIYTFFAVYLGNLIDLPEWTASITPIGVTPMIPSEDMDWSIILILIGICIALFVGGFITFKRRDLNRA